MLISYMMITRNSDISDIFNVFTVSTNVASFYKSKTITVLTRVQL